MGEAGLSRAGLPLLLPWVAPGLTRHGGVICSAGGTQEGRTRSSVSQLQTQTRACECCLFGRELILDGVYQAREENVNNPK